jgi:hypothetical protein
VQTSIGILGKCILIRTAGIADSLIDSYIDGCALKQSHVDAQLLHEIIIAGACAVFFLRLASLPYPLLLSGRFLQAPDMHPTGAHSRSAVASEGKCAEQGCREDTATKGEEM